MRVAPEIVLISEEQPFGVAESFFGEDQGLYLVTVCDTCLADFLDAAGRADVPVDPLGRTIKDRIVFELPESDFSVTLAERVERPILKLLNFAQRIVLSLELRQLHFAKAIELECRK